MGRRREGPIAVLAMRGTVRGTGPALQALASRESRGRNAAKAPAERWWAGPSACAPLAAQADISFYLAEEMMQQICSTLYERSHALHKAFIYLDERGDGWLPFVDFENARCWVTHAVPRTGRCRAPRRLQQCLPVPVLWP